MTAAPVLTKAGQIRLLLMGGDSAGRIFSFDKPVVTIGRGPENDIVLANDPKVSRVHAEIRQEAGQWMVHNVSQRNSILVHGERVEEKVLSHGQQIQIGSTILQIQLESFEDQATRLIPLQSEVTPQSVPPIVRKSQAPQPPPSQRSATVSAAPSPPRSRPAAVRGAVGGINSRMRLYVIVAVVFALGYWLLAGESKSKKKETALRSEGDVAHAIEESAQAVQELRKQQQSSGQDSLQYKAAQEHYIKGFRDYRQGQYARAMQSFQAALSFYPNHDLARKYLVQSQAKFEQRIDLNMAQGRIYKQKQNYRMCRSSFANVMIMVKDSSKPKYKEAKQNYDECSLRVEGKY